MFSFDLQEMSAAAAAVLEGNDAVTGHIISTTIGGKNGEPKQTISYMAERVVGTGSFGIVFQVTFVLVSGRICNATSFFFPLLIKFIDLLTILGKVLGNRRISSH